MLLVALTTDAAGRAVDLIRADGAGPAMIHLSAVGSTVGRDFARERGIHQTRITVSHNHATGFGASTTLTEIHHPGAVRV